MNFPALFSGRRASALGLFSFVCIALAACSSASGRRTAYQPPGFSSSSGQTFSDAEDAMARGDYFYAARAYQQAAATDPTHASELRLRAAEAAAAGGDFALADNLVARVPPQGLAPEQTLRVHLVRARAAFARGDNATAITLLKGDPPESPFAERALLVRARAQFRAGDTVSAVQSLVARERFLKDSHAIAENREAIWAGITTAPLDPGTLARAGNADTVTRGWIELANLARRNASLDFYNSWRTRYPGHPGEDRLASLYMGNSSPSASATGSAAPVTALPAAPGAAPVAATGPAQPPLVAGAGAPVLLLPTTGPLAALSDALRAGFQGEATRVNASVSPTVADTSAGVAAVTDAYQRASGSGAGLAIGPLRKDEVTALSTLATPVLPVLALNYLDAGHAANAGFYQFGLAPEDEARAAAEDAIARGFHRAIVLTQASEWGTRVDAAFQQRFTELGGQIVASDHYAGAPSSWSDPVKRLLRFHAIDDRQKIAELRATSGGDPQRRNDFDVIFLGAHGAGHARVLWPMFRFFHAERSPIYATAAINEGAGDQDLAGIRFCDAPWLLTPSNGLDALRTEALNGRNRDGARFYALGVDAFRLAQRMAQGGLRPEDEVQGATGDLHVGADGVIHRGLVCAQMSIGPPSVLGTPTPAVTQAPAAPPAP